MRLMRKVTSGLPRVDSLRGLKSNHGGPWSIEMKPWNLLERRNGALDMAGASKWSPGAARSFEMEPWSALER